MKKGEKRSLRLYPCIAYLEDYLKDEDVISPFEELEIKELKKRLYQFIEHLPRKERIVYKLRMIESSPYQRIIRITGQSKTAAERCFRRANSKVSKFLQEENLSRWPNQIIRALREY